MLRKHQNDKKNEIRQALFRIDVDLSMQPQNKFKIKKNAQQFHLNGLFVMIDKKLAAHLHNVVLVEGGTRTIQKYKRLMLRRIKWKEPSSKDQVDEIQEEEEPEEIKEIGSSSSDNKCHLVWEGVVAETLFDKFRAFYDVRTEYEGRKIFQERKQEHFWNSVVNYQPNRAVGFGE